MSVCPVKQDSATYLFMIGRSHGELDLLHSALIVSRFR